MCGPAVIVLAASLGISDCETLVTDIDIVELIRRYHPQYESVSIKERGVDQRGYPSFNGTAELTEDHFLEVHSTGHAKECGVDHKTFLKAKGDQATLIPTLKAGADVAFSGIVFLPAPGDIDPGGWRTPNGVSAILMMKHIRVGGEKLSVSGKPVSKFRDFDDAVVIDTPEFEKLCERARALKAG